MSLKLSLAVLTVAAAVCLTEADVRTRICRALCRTDEYDTGSYDEKTKRCLCGNFRKYEELTQKIRIPVHIPSGED